MSPPIIHLDPERPCWFVEVDGQRHDFDTVLEAETWIIDQAEKAEKK